MSDGESKVWSYVIVFAVGYFLGHSKAFKAGKQLGSRQGYAAGRGSKNCFVATACLGTPDAREVQILRRFRDEKLLKTIVGTQFCYLYYRIGPYLARFIERSPFARHIVLTLVVKPSSRLASFVLRNERSK